MRSKNKRVYLKLQKFKTFKLESMKQIIEKYINKVNVSYEKIARNVTNKTLANTVTSQVFKFEYDKRMFLPEKYSLWRFCHGGTKVF